MQLKGIFTNKPSSFRVVLLLFIMLISVMIHTAIASGLISIFGYNDTLMIYDLTNQVYVNCLKFMQLFSAIGLFITPILLFSYLTNYNLKFQNINRQNIMLVVAIMFLIVPFIELLLQWNIMINFPEWLMQFNIDSDELITAFLQMDTIGDLLYTLLIIAVVPAIGEELLFRGYLQQKLGCVLNNKHIAIVLTAFFFSAIHLHFNGLIPRFVLGVLLGYLFYWSHSLWMPILAHFLNNAQAVIFSYSIFKIEDGPYSLLSESKVDPSMAIFSLASVILLLYILYQNIKIKKADAIG